MNDSTGDDASEQPAERSPLHEPGSVDDFFATSQTSAATNATPPTSKTQQGTNEVARLSEVDAILALRASDRKRRPIRRAAGIFLTAAVVMSSSVFLAVQLARSTDPGQRQIAAPIRVESGLVQRGVGQYKFTQVTGDGRPVTWNSCEPIRWVLNQDQMPPGGIDAIRSAITKVEAATGFEFEFLGTTQELPTRNRAAFQPESWEGWAPVLIAFGPSATTETITADKRGVTIALTVQTRDVAAIVSGVVTINTDHNLEAFADDRTRSLEATVMHELAHLVGLAHVPSTSELMFAFPRPGPIAFSDGDLAGLAALNPPGTPCTELPEAQNLDIDVLVGG